MYIIKRFSKIYDEAKKVYDRKEDYELADIAKENNRLKGQVVGAGLGIVGGAYGGKWVRSFIKNNPNITKKIDYVAPGVMESLSKAAILPAVVAGTHYGGELTGNAAKNLVLKEIEDKRSNDSDDDLYKKHRKKLYKYV